MENPATSPLPRKGSARKMTFYEAIREALSGRRITKMEWDTNEVYCMLRDGFLKIYRDGKISNWIIAQEDVMGDDWVLLPEPIN